MNQRPPKFLEIALPVPLHRTFDYLLSSKAGEAIPAVGARVRVMFGHRKLVGLVVKQKNSTQVPKNKLRPILECLDETPLLSHDDLALALWLVRYYHAPPGEVVALTLPKALRQGKAFEPFDTSSTEAASEVPSKAKSFAAGASAEAEIDPKSYALTPEQKRAVQALSAHLEGFHPFLLEGVTGSGKTEVYLQAAEKVLDEGRQVLILVPEIGLVAQLARRVERRFGIEAALYHSDLSEKKRLDVWRRCWSGVAKIVVGTRSSLFLPMPKLGLLMVDEEHDLSYKQQEGARYSARDVAVRRAQTRDIPIVLGSATPALESLYNVSQGRYQALSLPERVTQRALPEVELVDIRGISCRDGLSPRLVQAIQTQLDAGEQVLLFLNRRGYASVIYCLDCGWVASCSRCAIGFTYHQGQNRLRCHRCGVSRPLHPECPECGGERLMPLGKGTERVELALKTRFPEQVIARIDRDTARSSKAFEEVMSEVRERKVDILVGTQMLAKGHHLPGIGLAAIVDMDSALYSLDFRSLERAGQMVTQVFGRSGRGDSQGRVMIQTSSPEHPMLQLLLNEGYAPFAQKLLQERSEALLPPYSFQVLIRAQAHRLEQVERFLKEVRGRVAAMRVAEVECYGPMVGGIEKSAGFHHRLLVMHAPRRSPLHAVLRLLVQQLDLSTTMRSVRWHIDVDPQEMG